MKGPPAAPETPLRSLATTHGNDDLKGVALRQLRRGMQPLGHDLAITLYRQPLAGEAHLVEQTRHGDRPHKSTGLAIDSDGKGCGRSGLGQTWREFTTPTGCPPPPPCVQSGLFERGVV